MFLFFLLPSTLWAATLAVGPTGPYYTISEAVADATDGDEIVIESGTYYEDVSLSGRSLTLIGPGARIVGTATCLDARGSAVVNVTGLTLQDCGRGLDGDGELSLEDVAFEDVGTGEEDGAAIRVAGAQLLWVGGSVEGAVASRGAVYAESSTVELVSVEWSEGIAQAGAALYATDSDVQLTGALLNRNSATAAGGALYVSGGTARIDGTTLLDNVSGAEGGCVAASNVELSVEDSTFERCSAEDPGGAIWLGGGALAIDAATFAENQAPGAADLYVQEAPVTIATTRFADPIVYHTSTTFCEDGSFSVDVEAPGQDVTLSDLALDGYWASGCAGFTVQAAYLSIENVTINGGGVSSTDYIATMDVSADDVELTGVFVSDGQEYVRGTTLRAADVEWSGGGTVCLQSNQGLVERLGLTDSTLQLDGVDAVGGISVTQLTSLGGDVELRNRVDLVDAGFTGGMLVVGRDGAPAQASLDLVRIEAAVSRALTVEGGSTATISRLRVAGAGGRYPAAFGGGLYVSDSDVVVTRSWFGGNAVTEGGGAIALDGGSLDVTASVFSENSAGLQGGAIWVGEGDLSVDGVIFQDNQADEGAAVYVTTAFPTLLQITAVGNESTTGTFQFGGGYADITNVITAVATSGGGFHAADDLAGSYSTLTYNDVWDNAGGGYTGAFIDVTGADGNLGADPTFVAYSGDGDASNDDLHLQAGSPCLDAGDPARMDLDGSRSDIGAYGGAYGALIDYDGDLVLGSEGDCDDADATVNPDAEEVPYDGVDNDCDDTTPDGADDTGGDTGGETDPPEADTEDTDASSEPEGCSCDTTQSGAAPVLALLATLLARRRTPSSRGRQR